MTISIETISFNHDPSSATRDALTISKNQVSGVSVPEWRSGMSLPEESPAAYTIAQIVGNTLTIKARFRRTSADTDSATVTVHATARTGNVLGVVRSQTINFGSDMSAEGLFELNTLPADPGVGIWDIAWDWHVDGVFFQTTRHRIYTLVSAPQAPWGQDGSTFIDFQYPWTEVLDHACREAAGAKTVDDAALKLTNWLYSLGPNKLQYDERSGDSHFTLNGMQNFACTRFLELLAEGPGTRATVNCTDCATILSSFANILGCNLVQSRIGYEFQTNLIQKIGLSFPYRQPFRFHEVAWKFPSNGDRDAFIYDACLEFDGDRNLTDDRFSPTLGVKIPFGVPTREGYHRRLIAPTPAGIAATEQSVTRVQRKIDGQTVVRAATDPVQQRRLVREYDFDSWRGPQPVEPNRPCKSNNDVTVASSQAVIAQEQQTSDQQFLLNYSFNTDRFSPSGWKLHTIEHFEAKPDPFKLTDAIWAATDCSAAELRVLTYECSSISAARSFVLSLLGEFEVPSIKRRRNFFVNKKQVEIGDVAFADVDDFVLLFARANVVMLVQNTGGTIVRVSRFAYEMDGDIASNSDPKENLPEMKKFSIAKKTVRVGEEVPIQFHSGSPKKAQDTLFKCWVPSGQMLLKGDDLVYRPQQGGEQSISILELKCGEPTVRQVLTLSVEQPEGAQETECKEIDKPIQEKESLMPEILGTWSSIRPTSNGVAPADMRTDGFLHLNDYDAATGQITGHYADLDTRTIEEVTGYVTSILPNFYRLVLGHPMGTGFRRLYDGQLVVNESGIQLVVGHYSDAPDPAPTDLGASTALVARGDSAVVADSQDNGIWVATKP